MTLWDSSFTSMSNTKEFRHLTPEERETLEQFARLGISLDELQRRLGGMLGFDFGPSERRLTSYFLMPQPAVRVELQHIQNAMDKHSRGEITTEQLADWATMLLLNDAYDWEGPDEDKIAGWLNEISLLTLKTKEE
jgi:hypothetical protein